MNSNIRNSVTDDDDGGIPPTLFYGNIKQLAKNMSLNDAEAAISALPDSDVEEDMQNDIENFTDATERYQIEEDRNADNEELLEQENEEDIEDDIPLALLVQKLKQKPNTQKIIAKKKNAKKTVTWKKYKFSPPKIVFTPPINNNENAPFSQTPLMYFSKYFPNELFTEMAEKTNMYSIQKTGKNINTTEHEIRKLVALHIVMGILRFPRLRLYWAPPTRIKFLDEIGISRNRFESLRNNLHIVDLNEERNNDGDKLWKVRPIIKSFESRCEELVVEKSLCIDESIIPFKGQLSIKQYIKGKPNPWGIKIFMLCGASGIIYRSVVYQGSTTIPIDLREKYSATNGLVIHLSNRIPEYNGHKLFCDNYFTSLLLLQELLEKGIFVAGTIRANRLEKCPLKSEIQLKKIGRGSCDSLVTDDKKIVAVRWYDNKAVNMASNFVGIEPKDEVKRWDSKEGAYIMVKRPAVIRMYNLSMGGVDKSDFLIALYRTFIRSKKWTLRVIFHYFNLAVCNSWLEYQADMQREGMKKKDRMDLLQFTFSLTEALAFSGFPMSTPKRGRPLLSSNRNSPVSRESPVSRNSLASRDSPVLIKRQKPQPSPVDDVRFDNLGHWPKHSNGHEQRCKLETCGGRLRIQCEKCNVHLCLSKFKNCFKNFHVTK